MNNWKVTQKSRQIIFGNVSDFNPTLNPKNLKSRIGESLRRLKIESLDTYLLHHVPPQSRYDDFVDELIRIKQTGMTEKIGIALSDVGQTNLKWADEVLVPIDLFERVKAHSTKISVHGVFRKYSSDYSAALKELLSQDHLCRIFVHTEKLNHLISIRKYLDKIAESD